VLPANRSSAILYTYTPWVLPGKGGNWLFWNVWRRYASALGYARGMSFPFNEGWIGGACQDARDCFYPNSICIGNAGSRFCSLPCATYCPPRGDTGWAPVECITGSDGTGLCTAQCTDALGGCSSGTSCQSATPNDNPNGSTTACF
jgi:hypothetical protein